MKIVKIADVPDLLTFSTDRAAEGRRRERLHRCHSSRAQPKEFRLDYSDSQISACDDPVHADPEYSVDESLS